MAFLLLVISTERQRWVVIIWKVGDRRQLRPDDSHLAPHLEGNARWLYAGVKETKFGIEVQTASQDAARCDLARLLSLHLAVPPGKKAAAHYSPEDYKNAEAWVPGATVPASDIKYSAIADDGVIWMNANPTGGTWEVRGYFVNEVQAEKSVTSCTRIDTLDISMQGTESGYTSVVRNLHYADAEGLRDVLPRRTLDDER